MPMGAVVVGTGFGARVHVPALRNAGFEVAAMVGRDPEKTGRRADRLRVPRTFTSLAEALALPGVDVVSIAENARRWPSRLIAGLRGSQKRGSVTIGCMSRNVPVGVSRRAIIMWFWLRSSYTIVSRSAVNVGWRTSAPSSGNTGSQREVTWNMPFVLVVA